MSSKKSIILILISLLLFSVLGLHVNAFSSFSGLETQIFSDSSISKIKKMQLVLNEFGLYTGEIDGNYTSVESSLLTYQKSVGIINEDTDYGAGYFGIKTLTALQEDYPENFDEVTKKYLQKDEPLTNIRDFFITAYYSPVPGQRRYTTGSYYGDIRLNGEGKITASGKSVFEGLLAGPRNYEFGTKIEFLGLGVGVIEDRGGAIVNAGERGHEYDRIDIWMGYGDEGLDRALEWGTRKIKGKVVPKTRQINMDFGTSPVNKYINLKVNAESPIFDNVIKLQNLLTELSLFSGEIDGNFNTIRDILVNYQIKKNIIISKDDSQAGFFGDKTLAALREDYGGNIFKNIDNVLDEDVILSDDIRDKLNQLNYKISNLIDMKYGKNTLLAVKYRRDIRIAIDIQITKLNSDLRIKQLKYLKSLL